VQYILLIYGNEDTWNQLSAAEQAKIGADMGSFAAELGRSGKLRGGNPLQPVATATTVRMKDGKRLTTDGPFAETKEQLGGYMVIEAADLDEALAIVARIPPASPHTAIEVRPIQPVNM
jgi:hypothetical protein